MNCKTLFSIGAAAVSLSAMATVSSQEKLCRISLTSSTSSTIIAIPLIKPGSATEVVDVSKYVLTTGLTEGDTLRYKASDGTIYSWMLNSSKVWVAAFGDNTAPEALPRGGAVILTRTAAKDTLASTPIYLYGQFVNTELSQSAAVSATADSYTFMGNAKPAQVSINEIPFANGAGPAEGDMIAVPSDDGIGEINYVRKDGEWKVAGTQVVGRRVKVVFTTAEKTFKAGEGFWYVTPKGREGTVTINW